jgi:hypothetical protein
MVQKGESCRTKKAMLRLENKKQRRKPKRREGEVIVHSLKSSRYNQFHTHCVDYLDLGMLFPATCLLPAVERGSHAVDIMPDGVDLR